MTENKEDPVSGGLGLFFLGMGLKRSQQQLILRSMWVAIVSTHILWACGLLAMIGLPSPFARAATVEDLAHTVQVSARLQLTQELRVQTLYWCAAKEAEQKLAVEQTLNRLRDEYRRVTSGETPPEFRCPKGESL